jgi:cyclophilin family peptidyl-prolyl cis-trans isomerase
MMRRTLLLATAFALFAFSANATEVRFDTSLGSFSVTLDAAHAPKTVANFLRYVNEKHFDGTAVYRVVPGFVIQMGSYDAQGGARETHAPVVLESANGLKNLRGTLSMARSSDPNSGTAEFFVNLSDNDSLDPDAGAPPNQTGYAVFGKVVEGMAVVDRIAQVQLGGGHGPFPPDASPAIPVTITKAVVSVP